MKLVDHVNARRKSGFTLIEIMVTLPIMFVIGYGLTVAIKAGRQSEQTVMRVTTQDKELHSGTISLVDEFRTSTDTTITVTTLADGNSQVRFMVPCDDAGALAWGVYDRSLGPDAATQNKVNWSICYTVRTVAIGNGKTNKQLVRQVLDTAQVIQSEKVIVDWLRSGTVAPPGFNIVKTGDVWTITLSTDGQADGSAPMRAVFHVKTRN